MATGTMSEAELVAALEAMGSVVVLKKPGDIKTPPPSLVKIPGVSLGGVAPPSFLTSPIVSTLLPHKPTLPLTSVSMGTSSAGTPSTTLPPTTLGLQDYLRKARQLGARAKEPLTTSTPARTGPVMSPDITTYHLAPPPFPKVSFFSGDDLKTDVPYHEWRFEVRCLENDPEVPESHLLNALRKSLRGSAKSILCSVGDRATYDVILAKLDSHFGDVSSKGILMQDFYNTFQQPDENVTSFGCRLERLLQLAIDHGHIESSERNDLLRNKFWPSLASDKLKSQTRHKYDSITSYDDLLKEIRTVEKEISMVPSASASVPKKAASHQPVLVEDQLKEIERRFDQKFESMEKRFDAKMEEKFNLILQKLDRSSDTTYGDGSYSHGGSANYNNNNNNNFYNNG